MKKIIFFTALMGIFAFTTYQKNNKKNNKNMAHSDDESDPTKDTTVIEVTQVNETANV